MQTDLDSGDPCHSTPPYWEMFLPIFCAYTYCAEWLYILFMQAISYSSHINPTTISIGNISILISMRFVDLGGGITCP